MMIEAEGVERRASLFVENSSGREQDGETMQPLVDIWKGCASLTPNQPPLVGNYRSVCAGKKVALGGVRGV